MRHIGEVVLPEIYFTQPQLVSVQRSCLRCFQHRFRTLQRLPYGTIEFERLVSQNRIVKLAESLNRVSASLYFGGSSSRARSVAAEVVC
jgi:hypothetical protein